jgi:hypothetical protein
VKKATGQIRWHWRPARGQAHLWLDGSAHLPDVCAPGAPGRRRAGEQAYPAADAGQQAGMCPGGPALRGVLSQWHGYPARSLASCFLHVRGGGSAQRTAVMAGRWGSAPGCHLCGGGPWAGLCAGHRPGQPSAEPVASAGPGCQERHPVVAGVGPGDGSERPTDHPAGVCLPQLRGVADRGCRRAAPDRREMWSARANPGQFVTEGALVANGVLSVVWQRVGPARRGSLPPPCWPWICAPGRRTDALPPRNFLCLWWMMARYLW